MIYKVVGSPEIRTNRPGKMLYSAVSTVVVNIKISATRNSGLCEDLDTRFSSLTVDVYIEC